MASSLVLSLNEADQFVTNQRTLGNDVRWDGWTLVFYKPTHYGFTQPVVQRGNIRKVGAFRRGRWGLETRISVDGDGTWKVPFKNVKSVK